MRCYRGHLAAWLLVVSVEGSLAFAQDLLVTNFFFNTVDRYHSQTGALVQSGFFVAPEATLAGLAGIAVDYSTNRVYASGRFVDRVYVFDGLTGAPLPTSETPTGMAGVFAELATGAQPAGLAVDSSGRLYVANSGGTTVDIFDTSTGSLVDSISDAKMASPSGLHLDADGNLFITNLGGTGTLRYDGTNVGIFALPDAAAGPFVPSGVVSNSAGEVFVADVFGDGIFKYDSSGNQVGYFDISSLIPPPGVVPSFDFAAPSGLVLDESGDLLVAVMGFTNPGEGEINGALLRVSSADGTLLQTLYHQGSPLSAITFAPVPEPGSAVLLAICAGLAGAFWRAKRRRS